MQRLGQGDGVMGPVQIHLKQDPEASAWCQAACAVVGARTPGPAFDKTSHFDEGPDLL